MNIRLFTPLIVFLPATWVLWQFKLLSGVPESVVPSVAGTFTQVGASMLGFMLAAMAILATISDAHLVKVMKVQGHYSDLLKTLFIGCLIYLVMTGIGVVLLFCPSSWEITKVLLVAVSISALTSLTDLGHKFWLVLSNLHK
jgi:hypothetical protein